MIDAQGISNGKEVRSILEQLENSLIINYRNTFSEKKDLQIDQVDLNLWRNKKINELERFKKTNKSIIKSYIKPIEKAIYVDLEASYVFGINYVEKQLNKAASKGKQLANVGYKATGFQNNLRVKKQVLDIKNKLNSAFNNTLKSLELQYMTTIYKVPQLVDHSPTLFSAIDNASKALLAGGITGGITTNGRKLNMVNLIELQSIESSQELMFLGEAEKASEVGNYLVYITEHVSSCKLCTPWAGKVLIDDVYQNGKPDGKHQLLSFAIKAGLFHYNCRHNRLTFIEGVDSIPSKPSYVPKTSQEQHELYEKEQKQRAMERQIRKWKRIETGSLSTKEQRYAHMKVRQWQYQRTQLVKGTPGLYRANYWREKPGFKMPQDPRAQDLRYNKQLLK